MSMHSFSLLLSKAMTWALHKVVAFIPPANACVTQSKSGEEGHRESYSNMNMCVQKLKKKKKHVLNMCPAMSMTYPCPTCVRHGYIHQINVFVFLRLYLIGEHVRFNNSIQFVQLSLIKYGCFSDQTSHNHSHIKIFLNLFQLFSRFEIFVVPMDQLTAVLN